MADDKVVTYRGPAEGQAFEVDKQIDLNDAGAGELSKDWFPPAHAKAILAALAKKKLCLGVGRRGSQIVKRWQDKQPWLPAMTIVTKMVGEEKQNIRVGAAETAPLLKQVLYDEAVKLDQLRRLTENAAVAITSFGVYPEWQHETNMVKNIAAIHTAADVKLDGGVYSFGTVPSNSLTAFVSQFMTCFRAVLLSAEDPFQNNLQAAKFEPNPAYAGLCGAWYLVKVDYTEPAEAEEKETEPAQAARGVSKPIPRSLAFRVPLGLLSKANDKLPLEFRLAPWSTAERSKSLPNIFTAGLDFRFLCQDDDAVPSDEQFHSHMLWLNAQLNHNEPPILIDPPIEPLREPFNRFCRADSKAWRRAEGDARREAARLLAPLLVGGEPLAVFMPNSIVHLLENRNQIAAWCAQHALLDKFGNTSGLREYARLLALTPPLNVWATKYPGATQGATLDQAGTICDLTAYSLMVVAAGSERIEGLVRNQPKDRGDSVQRFRSGESANFFNTLGQWAALGGDGVVQFKFAPDSGAHTFMAERRGGSTKTFHVFQSYQGTYRLRDFLGVGERDTFFESTARALLAEKFNNVSPILFDATKRPDNAKVAGRWDRVQAQIPIDAKKAEDDLDRARQSIGLAVSLSSDDFLNRVVRPLSLMLGAGLAAEGYVALTGHKVSSPQTCPTLLAVLCNEVDPAGYAQNYHSLANAGNSGWIELEADGPHTHDEAIH